MTTIHVQRLGDKALLLQSEFERLVELARQYEEIAVQMHEDDVPTLGIMRLAEQGGAFDFWRRPVKIFIPQKTVNRCDTSNACSW